MVTQDIGPLTRIALSFRAQAEGNHIIAMLADEIEHCAERHEGEEYCSHMMHSTSHPTECPDYQRWIAFGVESLARTVAECVCD